jgi:HEAT repeat protein
MSLLYEHLDGLPADALIALFAEPPPDGEADGALYFEEVAVRISSSGADGLAFLERVFSQGAFDSDEPRLRALMSALTMAGVNSPTVRNRLRTLLNDPRPPVIAGAIYGLARLQTTPGENSVFVLRDHVSPYVRAAVLAYIRKVETADQALPVLLGGLADSHFIVRESAADELGEMRDERVIPNLRPLLNDPEPDVRAAAETAIKILESLR